MIARRAALLSLVLSAACGSAPEVPGAAAQRAAAAPTLSWSEIVSIQAPRVAAIGEADAILAGSFTGSLDIGGERLDARSESDIVVSRMDARGHHTWNEQLGAAARLSSMAAGCGRIALSGTSEGGIDLGGGPLRAGVFLAMLDGSGNHVWSRIVAGAEDVPRVQIGCDGVVALIRGVRIYLGEEQLSPAGGIVAKIDASGHVVWRKIYGPEVNAMDLAVAGDGDVIVSGSIHGSFDFGGGPVESLDTDALLVRYDADGNHLWSRHYGNTNDVQDARKLAVDGAGNIFAEQKEASGPELGLYAYDPRGEERWRRGLGADDVTAMTADHAGNLVYATAHSLSFVAHLRMLDGEGQLVWEQRLQENDGARISDMSITATGALLIAGRLAEPIDLWGPIASPSGQSTGFVASVDLDPRPRAIDKR